MGGGGGLYRQGSYNTLPLCSVPGSISYEGFCSRINCILMGWCRPGGGKCGVNKAWEREDTGAEGRLHGAEGVVEIGEARR